VCKKLFKNSQPFGKKFQKTVEGDFFDSHCMYIISDKNLVGHHRFQKFAFKTSGFVSDLAKLLPDKSTDQMVDYAAMVEPNI